jgi:DNA-binding Lrp family transcriptional regulator
MPCFFVFVNTKKGFEKSVLKKLRKLPKIKEAYLTHGAYDIVTKIDVDSIDNLKKVVAFNIRLQDNVESTLTMMVIEKKSENIQSNKKAIKVPTNPIVNN